MTPGFGLAPIKREGERYQHDWTDPRGQFGNLNKDPQSFYAVEAVPFFRGAEVGPNWRGPLMTDVSFKKNNAGQKVVVARSASDPAVYVELTMPAGTPVEVMEEIGERMIAKLNEWRVLP